MPGAPRDAWVHSFPIGCSLGTANKNAWLQIHNVDTHIYLSVEYAYALGYATNANPHPVHAAHLDYRDAVVQTADFDPTPTKRDAAVKLDGQTSMLPLPLAAVLAL